MPYYRRRRYRKYRPRIYRRRSYRRRRFIRRKWRGRRRRPLYSRMRRRVVSMWIKYSALDYAMPTYGAGTGPVLSIKNNYFRIGGSMVSTHGQPTAALAQYDQYRAAKIVSRWKWPGAPEEVRSEVTSWTGAIGTASFGGAWPVLHTQVDKDGLFPSTVDAMKENNGYKGWELRPGKVYSRSYRPSINQTLNSLTSGWRQIKNTWLSTQYDDVYQYGMSWTVDNTLGAVDWSPTRIWVEHWVKWQFRYPKPNKIPREMERLIA